MNVLLPVLAVLSLFEQLKQCHAYMNRNRKSATFKMAAFKFDKNICQTTIIYHVAMQHYYLINNSMYMHRIILDIKIK